MKYYLILSEGAYSDYSPEYFIGEKEVTKEVFEAKGREVGDRVIQEHEDAPVRPHVCGKYCYHSSFSPKPETEKFNPDTGESLYFHAKAGDWMSYMREWVLEQGFEPLPEDIPEINTAYSEFPHN